MRLEWIRYRPQLPGHLNTEQRGTKPRSEISRFEMSTGLASLPRSLYYCTCWALLVLVHVLVWGIFAGLTQDLLWPLGTKIGNSIAAAPTLFQW